MLQEDGIYCLLWLCLLLAHCHTHTHTHSCTHTHTQAQSPSSRSFRLFKIQSCFPPWLLPPAVIYNPFGHFGFIASQFVIFSTLGQLDFPCHTEESVLLRVQSVCYFKVPKHCSAPFGLGKRCGACKTSPSAEGRASVAFQAAWGKPARWPLACCCL